MTKTDARNQVLRHALECFMRFGYDRTAMQDIAVAAGLSRQGLYHHFPNKEELFAALIEAGGGATLKAAEAARDRARADKLPFASVMGATLEARLGSMHLRIGRSAEALEIVDQSLRRCGPILERQADLFHAMLTGMIEDEVAAGRLVLTDDVKPAELAEAFSAMARGANARLPQPKADALLAIYTRNSALLLRGASRQDRMAAE
jgi:AcrR family transcriptional regulator